MSIRRRYCLEILHAELFIRSFYVGGSDNNKGKSKKWKKILQFPHITQCLDLIQKISEYLHSFYNTDAHFTRVLL